jgi:hypothetical protein
MFSNIPYAAANRPSSVVPCLTDICRCRTRVNEEGRGDRTYRGRGIGGWCPRNLGDGLDGWVRMVISEVLSRRTRSTTT